MYLSLCRRVSVDARVSQSGSAAAADTHMALFHCMVRYGTAQFGSVCVSTAV